jgi:hypothetical protein
MVRAVGGMTLGDVERGWRVCCGGVLVIVIAAASEGEVGCRGGVLVVVVAAASVLWGTVMLMRAAVTQ